MKCPTVQVSEGQQSRVGQARWDCSLGEPSLAVNNLINPYQVRFGSSAPDCSGLHLTVVPLNFTGELCIEL